MKCTSDNIEPRGSEISTVRYTKLNRLEDDILQQIVIYKMREKVPIPKVND